MLEVSEFLNANILIVDDQKANIVLLEQMLRHAGYLRVSSTMDPRQVCPLYAQHRYDLVLLDLQMPEMDGFEVMEGLKQIEPDGYFPVLVITAQPSHKLRALQVGAKDFVSKPFDLIEVQTRIHNMLEVRLLYRKLANYNKELEQTVLERTAELRESEARFKSFTELSSDWYWEQDAQGNFTKVSGPVFEMLGIQVGELLGADTAASAGRWNASERELLLANIAERRPFLDFVYSRSNPDGGTQYLKVSGEPMFDTSSRFIGYRGIGMELTKHFYPNMEHSEQAEQARFRNAMGLIDQGVCLIDCATMQVVDVNDTACRIAGYTRTEFLALAGAQLGLGADVDLLSSFDVLLAADPHQSGPEHFVQKLALRQKGGSTVAVSIHWHALPDTDKRVVVGVISLVK